MADAAAPGLPVATAAAGRDRDRDKDDRRRWAARCGFAALGIMGTLLVYGVLQEKIMRILYGAEKEFFRYSLFLVFCNRITTSMVSAMVLLASKKSLDPVAPLHKYGVVSISNILTTTCQYEALKYVSFPVQTPNTCQMCEDDTCDDLGHYNNEKEVWWKRLLLCYHCDLGLLIVHSIPGIHGCQSIQQRQRKHYLGCITHAWLSWFRWLHKHVPRQTLQRLVSILLSCVWFVHPLSWMQWVGAVIVFGALYTKSFLRGKPPKPAIASPPRGSSPNPSSNS